MNNNKYYLLTKDQYEIHKEKAIGYVAWTLDEASCIIEAESLESDFTFEWPDANTCNVFRYDQTTEEWRNWMTEEDYFAS